MQTNDSVALEDWLDSERNRLLGWNRDDLIDWLVWVDSNGVWTDEDMQSEGMDPMSLEDAVDAVMMFVEENKETPEEMMNASREANPDRYTEPTFHAMADKGRHGQS
jgi:hypothetical protein